MVIEIAPRIWRIPTLGDYINSFAFEERDGSVTLIDCGLKRAPKKIVRALGTMGKDTSDVQRIILTHAHNDHAGGAAHIAALSGASGVDVHSEDAPFVRAGESPPRDTSTTAGKLFARLPGGGFDPLEVSQELQAGDVLDIAGGVEVHHTPGHTPGHISLLHQESGVLITGDAIFNMRARMSWPIAAFCTSARLNEQSAHVLGELVYHTAAFTHGPHIAKTGREAIREFLRRAER